MQRTLLYKILAILALTLLICVPLMMIQSTIRERNTFREEAVASIAADSVRAQTVVGPVLVLRYTDEYDERVVDASDAKKIDTITRAVTRTQLVYPNALRIGGNIETDRRYRGIHQVLVYSGLHRFTGDFALPYLNELPRENARSRITLNRAYIALGIDDVRGIRNLPKINWDGHAFDFKQGSDIAALPGGVHADLDIEAMGKAGEAAFSFDLALDGIERQSFVPVGKNNTISITSNWAHPAFGGDFLPSPRKRTINDKGFAATWNITSLSTKAQQQLSSREAASPDARAAPFKLDTLNIGFIEPINVYSLAERATKYGLLFVALTFAAFFVFEILKRLPIHPVQYLLVGLALVLFFLLLVGLSEHIAFIAAYLVASVACIVLIAFYLSFVLHDWRRGVGFGSALTMLYSALYGLLISENNALVLGSILLFAVLAAVMVATRKVDWYQVGKADGAPSAA
jgi:inner membrane protein